MAERVDSEALDFTPFSGFSGQALISRWFAVVRMHRHGRSCSLFSIAYRLPKLDVADPTFETHVLVNRGRKSLLWDSPFACSGL